MWLLLAQPLVLAQPPVEVANFTAPVPVPGFVERAGSPGCSVHFEFEDPGRGWTRYRHGLTIPTSSDTPLMDPVTFMPPHDEAPPWPSLCGSDPALELEEWQTVYLWARLDTRWRIVNRDGAVLTFFDGPYASDVRLFAAALAAPDEFATAEAGPTCTPRAGHTCWTAFELWVYLEDWTAAHCSAESEEALPAAP